MKIRQAVLGILAIILTVGVVASQSPTNTRRIGTSVLEDKIRGGWAGQMIGVSYGAATEFRARGTTFDAELTWSPERVSNSIGQDDLYVEMTFAEVMAKDLKVMDSTAIAFCRDNQIPIVVFDLLKPGNLRSILEGDPIGTLVG